MKPGGANGIRAICWTFMKAKRLWRWSIRPDGSQTNNCSRVSCNVRLIGQFSRCPRNSEWRSYSAVTKTRATRKSERFLDCRLLRLKAYCFAHEPNYALRLITILSVRFALSSPRVLEPVNRQGGIAPWFQFSSRQKVERANAAKRPPLSTPHSTEN